MKVEAKVVADHLYMVAMGKRIEEVVLGPNFAASVVDQGEEVMLRATCPGVKFPGKFGVVNVAHLAKVFDSFEGEVDVEVEKGGKDGLEKLVISSPNVIVWYQTADVDKISTTLASFGTADEALSAELAFETVPDATFLPDLSKYYKRISPDLVEISVKGKKLVMHLISGTTRHKAEVVVGDATAVSKKKFSSLKVGAAVLGDVMDGVKPVEGDQLKVSVGAKALRVEFRTYAYLLSPRVEVE